MDILIFSYLFFFFFNDTATTEIYTLSLHDALPISHTTTRPAAFATRGPTPCLPMPRTCFAGPPSAGGTRGRRTHRDRKSTRLNSSHANISYAVFCLKKKKKNSIL